MLRISTKLYCIIFNICALSAWLGLYFSQISDILDYHISAASANYGLFQKAFRAFVYLYVCLEKQSFCCRNLLSVINMPLGSTSQVLGRLWVPNFWVKFTFCTLYCSFDSNIVLISPDVAGNNNNNNNRLIRRCQNATCYNDMDRTVKKHEVTEVLDC